MMFSQMHFVSVIIISSAIAAVMNLKTIIKQKSPDSYLNIILGLSLIDFSLFCKILNENALLTTIPFLNNPLFFEIVYSITVFTGIILLVKGVSTWMPIFNTFKNLNTIKLNKLQIFKKIDQLLLIENRFEILCKNAAEIIANQCRFNGFTAYLYSNKKNRFIAIDSKEQDDQLNISAHQFLDNETNNIARTECKTIECIVNGKPLSKIIIPIVLHNSIIGKWEFTSINPLDDDDISNIKIIADTLASKADLIRLGKILGFRNDIIKWRSKLKTIIQRNASLADNLVHISSFLREKISFNVLSVTILEKNEYKKITISKNNQLLITSSQISDNEAELDNYVIKTGLDVVISDLERETTFIIDPVILKSNLKSLITIPVTEEDAVLGLITLAAEEKNSFTIIDNLLTKMISEQISVLFKQEEKRSFETQNSNIQHKIKNFSRYSARIQNIESLYKITAEYLYDILDAEFIRFSTVEPNSRFINSVCLSSTQQSVNCAPAVAPLMLHLLPRHEEVVKSRKVFVSDDSNHISSTEKNHIFEDTFDRLIVVPVQSDNQITSLCSIGIKKENVIQNNIEIVSLLIEQLTVQLNRIRSTEWTIKKNISTAKSKIRSLQRVTDEQMLDGIDSTDYVSQKIGL